MCVATALSAKVHSTGPAIATCAKSGDIKTAFPVIPKCESPQTAALRYQNGNTKDVKTTFFAFALMNSCSLKEQR